uniref:receptor activity-modifying protein 1-like isoform X2 n=1 Tax=Myxine glutinosa TaxID=7769 RepID=UPI00358F9CDD
MTRCILRSALLLAVTVLGLALCVPECNDTSLWIDMRETCYSSFDNHISTLNESLHCNWTLTYRFYDELTHCTKIAAQLSKCFWPNEHVDQFFMEVHRTLLAECLPQPVAQQDPPDAILAALISTPMLLTTIMAALVVWCSKRNPQL